MEEEKVLKVEPFFGFSKVGYLQELCNKFGDFKVAKGWLDASGDIRWSKHFSVMECWQTEAGIKFLETVNNRGGLDAEVRIDIDAGERTPEVVRKQFDDACDTLDKMGKSYLGFTSGSRGYHIHIFFEDLVSKDYTTVRAVKSYLVSKLGGEMLKINNSPMLTLEWSPNNKTGKLKLPIRGTAIWMDVNK
jgi:hypothetical protein